MTTETARANWTLSGVIEAPVAQVWTALLDATPGLTPENKDAITNQAGPQHFTVTRAGATMYVEVDKQQHSLAVQGAWWYRGVYTLEPHTGGSRVVYRVYNIAPGVSRWLVPLLHRAQNYDAQIRGQFQQTLRAIGD